MEDKGITRKIQSVFIFLYKMLHLIFLMEIYNVLLLEEGTYIKRHCVFLFILFTYDRIFILISILRSTWDTFKVI